jgi:hypothetical protein
MSKPNEYLGTLDTDKFQAEEDFLNSHWANDLLDAPHALIAVIETRIARAVIAREREILKLLEEERLKHIPWCGKNACQICEQTMGIEKALALIKGEQK